ncbi:MAG: hypothetical protein KBD78_07535 [Oligoflexales bacterium]|nr:hypothetical protein [Oligoflexales bacterium]
MQYKTKVDDLFPVHDAKIFTARMPKDAESIALAQPIAESRPLIPKMKLAPDAMLSQQLGEDKTLHLQPMVTSWSYHHEQKAAALAKEASRRIESRENFNAYMDEKAEEQRSQQFNATQLRNMTLSANPKNFSNKLPSAKNSAPSHELLNAGLMSVTRESSKHSNSPAIAQTAVSSYQQISINSVPKSSFSKPT